MKIAFAFALAFAFTSACGESPTRDAGVDAARRLDAGTDAPSCPSPSCPACNNGTDDDGDELVDYPFDPGCERREDDDEGEPPPGGPCANDIDDDEDGAIDYPADPGCRDEEDEDETDPPPPACSNEADDDDDELGDYPADPGCADALDDDESDTCPDGPACPECANGDDDDGDDVIDYPLDAECISASDTDERCRLIGGFESDWPGEWINIHGASPFDAGRRRSAAHDGEEGIFNSAEVIYVPSVVTGAPGESASMWTRTLGDPRSSVSALHFAIEPGGVTDVCMLNLAGELVIGTTNAGFDTVVLGTATFVREAFVWYRLEVAFLSEDRAECRVYGELSDEPLASINATFARSLAGPVGFHGFPQSAVDSVEVCR